MAARLAKAATTYYVNSVLVAQVWRYIMSLIFNTAIWDPWEARLLSMFVNHAGEVVNPLFGWPPDQFI